MTPEELRAKVAQAMHATYCIEFGGTPKAAASLWSGMTEPSKQSWMRRADAALAVVREAMREPSEEMAIAGGMGVRLTSLLPPRDQAHAAWLQMLPASPLAEPSS